MHECTDKWYVFVCLAAGCGARARGHGARAFEIWARGGSKVAVTSGGDPPRLDMSDIGSTSYTTRGCIGSRQGKAQEEEYMPWLLWGRGLGGQAVAGRTTSHDGPAPTATCGSIECVCWWKGENEGLKANGEGEGLKEEREEEYAGGVELQTLYVWWSLK